MWEKDQNGRNYRREANCGGNKYGRSEKGAGMNRNKNSQNFIRSEKNFAPSIASLGDRDLVGRLSETAGRTTGRGGGARGERLRARVHHYRVIQKADLIEDCLRNVDCHQGLMLEPKPFRPQKHRIPFVQVETHIFVKKEVVPVQWAFPEQERPHHADQDLRLPGQDGAARGAQTNDIPDF